MTTCTCATRVDRLESELAQMRAILDGLPAVQARREHLAREGRRVRLAAVAQLRGDDLAEALADLNGPDFREVVAMIPPDVVATIADDALTATVLAHMPVAVRIGAAIERGLRRGAVHAQHVRLSMPAADGRTAEYVAGRRSLNCDEATSLAAVGEQVDSIAGGHLSWQPPPVRSSGPTAAMTLATLDVMRRVDPGLNRLIDRGEIRVEPCTPAQNAAIARGKVERLIVSGLSVDKALAEIGGAS